MLPHLDLGPLHISSYFLLYAVAILTGGMLAFRRLARSGIGPGDAIGFMSVAIAAAIAGSRLLYWSVLHALPMPEAGPRHIDGGSTAFGALFFGAAAAFLYGRARRLPTGTAFDALFGAVPLAQAIGRVGCHLAGCCWGKPTDSWFGVILPGAGGRWEPRYPTQLLTSGVDLAIFLLLLGVERHLRGANRCPGLLALLYFQVHFLARFLIEFLRDEQPFLWAPFSWAHGAAALGFIAASVGVAWTLRPGSVHSSPGGGRASRCCRPGSAGTESPEP